MKKKILLISPQPFFQWRGSPIRVKFNVLALTNLGYDVDLLTFPVGDDIPLEGVRIIRVANPFQVKNVTIGPSFWKVFFDALLFLKGLQLCSTNEYSAIHGIEEAGIIAALLARKSKAHLIYEKHSDPFSYEKGIISSLVMRAYSNVEKMTVKMADAVIATGPGLTAQVNAMGTGKPCFTIFDIPSSLREAAAAGIAEKRLSLLKNEKETIITYVGSFAVYQGIELLFSAIPAVINSAPHARFIVIGGNAEEIRSRQSELQARGVADKVTFLGKIAPDLLPEYLAASDILLSPRLAGVNTPLKVLDYMKAGRAVVATDIVSNRLLLDEQTAVFSAAEPESYAAAIVSLVNDNAKRIALGQSCRNVYEERYTFAHYCRRLQECYSTMSQQV